MIVINTIFHCIKLVINDIYVCMRGTYYHLLERQACRLDIIAIAFSCPFLYRIF